MNVLLLANPDAGGGTDTGHVAEALARHGAAVVDDEARAERVVVSGGDGTIGRGAELAARLGLPLGVIPAGTANDFACSLGLPRDLDEAVRLAATGTRTRRLELGRLDGRAFVNVAGAGLAPAAARRAAPLKRVLGPLAYPAGALCAGLLERPIECTAAAGGREVFCGRAWQVIVASSGAFGGGAAIDCADPDDGRLDLLVLPDSRRVHLLRVGLAMRRGTLADAPGVVHARDDAITLRVPAGTAFNVDGEAVEAGGAVAVAIDARSYALVVGVERASSRPPA